VKYFWILKPVIVALGRRGKAEKNPEKKLKSSLNIAPAKWYGSQRTCRNCKFKSVAFFQTKRN
jgi:hypothetical protein